MAVETKKYLDLVGLTHYDEKIKAYIKTNGSDVTDKLVALIGAAEKGADQKTILARVADLEAAVGDVTELDSEVKNLVKAILGESARAKAAEEANATAIGAEKTRAEGAESDLQDAIDAEEAARKAQVGEIGEKTVKAYVDDAIDSVNGDAEALEARVKANEDAIVVINGEATVEGSIKKAAADAVAQVLDKAPEAFDTLKEVAEWISASADNEAGFDAANRIVALETAVSANDTAVKGLIEAEETRATAAEEANAAAISAEQTRAEGAESDLQDAIDGVEEKVDAFAAISNDEIDALFAPKTTV